MSLTWPDYNGNRMFQSLGKATSVVRLCGLNMTWSCSIEFDCWTGKLVSSFLNFFAELLVTGGAMPYCLSSGISWNAYKFAVVQGTWLPTQEQAWFSLILPVAQHCSSQVGGQRCFFETFWNHKGVNFVHLVCSRSCLFNNWQHLYFYSLPSLISQSALNQHGSLHPQHHIWYMSICLGMGLEYDGSVESYECWQMRDFNRGCAAYCLPDYTWLCGDAGETTINWDDTSMPGAERSIHVAIKDWRWTENALPLRRVGKVGICS